MSSAENVLLVLTLCALIVSLLVLIQFLLALRRISKWPTGGDSDHPSEPAPGPPRLSVIVPARNEEVDLDQALRSILRQTGVDLEVIVVNDHSTDATGAIADALAAADSRLRVIHHPDLPPGWLGKCNAMHHGTAIASGELLLFTDADVIHEPTCFSAALEQLQPDQFDLVSFFPRVECVSFWEHMLVPLYVAGIAQFATSAIHDPRSSEALAAGALLLVRPAALRKIGGWEALKSEMLDDVSLARQLKAAGCRVGFQAAPHLLRVRLFKSNRDAFLGTRKNMLAVLRGKLWLAPAIVLLPPLVLWTPLVAIAWGCAAHHVALIAVGILTYAIQYATCLSSRRLIAFRASRAILFPLGVLPVLTCFVWAFGRYLVRGEIFWRGRAVRIVGGDCLRP